MSGYKRLTINIADELHAELQAIADERGIDITELVRRAIALDRFVWQHRDESIAIGDAKAAGGWKGFANQVRDALARQGDCSPEAPLIRELEAERDLYRSIAERYADLWQPQFSLNPDEGLWVFPWDDDVEPEAMTSEQVAWLRAKREART